MEKVNVNQKFTLFNDFWSPKVVGELNGQQVRLVKLRGEFVWHHHEQEDELFYVIQGQLKIEFRDRQVILDPGEFIIIPKGVEHKPIASEEVHVMLIEPMLTLNTGNVIGEQTVMDLKKL